MSLTFSSKTDKYKSCSKRSLWLLWITHLMKLTKSKTQAPTVTPTPRMSRRHRMAIGITKLLAIHRYRGSPQCNWIFLNLMVIVSFLTRNSIAIKFYVMIPILIGEVAWAAGILQIQIIIWFKETVRNYLVSALGISISSISLICIVFDGICPW